MKRYEYLKRVYDNDANLDFDLAKLGAVGWLMTGVVRYNPSPSRVNFIVWFAREMVTGKNKPKTPEKLAIEGFGVSGNMLPIVGKPTPRVEGDPLRETGTYWPTFDPDENPFDDGELDLPEDL